MFKNIITYAIPSEWSPDLTVLEEALTRSKFVECGASQEKSMGWVEPRGEKNGPLLESVGGQWLLKLQTETKVLPRRGRQGADGQSHRPNYEANWASSWQERNPGHPRGH